MNRDNPLYWLLVVVVVLVVLIILFKYILPVITGGSGEEALAFLMR